MYPLLYPRIPCSVLSFGTMGDSKTPATEDEQFTIAMLQRGVKVIHNESEK